MIWSAFLGKVISVARICRSLALIRLIVLIVSVLGFRLIGVFLGTGVPSSGSSWRSIWWVLLISTTTLIILLLISTTTLVILLLISSSTLVILLLISTTTTIILLLDTPFLLSPLSLFILKVYLSSLPLSFQLILWLSNQSISAHNFFILHTRLHFFIFFILIINLNKERIDLFILWFGLNLLNVVILITIIIQFFFFWLWHTISLRYLFISDLHFDFPI